METLNSISESESITREEDPCSVINSLMKSKYTVHDLPTDILAELFGYLTHTGKLISRLVCQDWNNQISSFLSKNSYFAVKSKASSQVILNSDVQWKKIKLSDSGFMLRTKNITTLQMDICGLRECMEVVVAIPHLTTLELNILEDKKVIPTNTSQKNTQEQEDLKLKAQFKTFVKKLRILSVKFTMKNVETLLGLLREIDTEDGTLGLYSLKIEEEYSLPSGESDGHLLLLSEMYRIISKSSRTLHGLAIDFTTETILLVLFTELVSKLCDLKELKLASVRIQPNWDWKVEGVESVERDFLIHQKFLKTQMDENSVVKNITLPWTLDASLCQEIQKYIPRNIKSVWCVHKEHITGEFYSAYRKLKTMYIVSRELSMFSQPCPNMRNLCIAIPYRDDLCDTAEETIFYWSLCEAFMNLVQLAIDNTHFPFYNQNLQVVIQSLKKLRILQVGDASHITDFGVTGIDDEYSVKLVETGRLHLHRDFPRDKIIGLPLSSLKQLERLVLYGTAIPISDFGVYYGLQFGARLKRISFGTSEKITDWGLHWLGAGNPLLESFEGAFKSASISDEGVEILREQLPLIKSTQKFKLSTNIFVTEN